MVGGVELGEQNQAFSKPPRFLTSAIFVGFMSTHWSVLFTVRGNLPPILSTQPFLLYEDGFWSKDIM